MWIQIQRNYKNSIQIRILFILPTNFYKGLYTADPNVPIDRKNELLEIIDKQLDIKSRKKLDEKITKEDLYDNLRETENSKALGIDGLPFEFY